MSEVWADRDRRRRSTPVLVAAAFAGIGGEFFRAFRYLVLSSTWRHAAHRIAFLPRVTIPCKLLDWGWIKNAGSRFTTRSEVNLHDADPLIDQLEMKKVEKEDSIGLAEPKRRKVERTANKLTTARPSNARSTLAKPRTTRFRPKNRKQPRTTRPFTFYEMTERHIIHSKFQWRTSQLDQRRSRLVLDTYGEGTFRWSFRTSKGQRRTMPKRLFQNCLLENKVNVVPDGLEPINEEGVSLAEESESSHLSGLLSSDGKDKAPISTDQTNFEVFSKSIEDHFEELGLTEEGEVASQRISLWRQRKFEDKYRFHAQPVQTIRRLRMQSAPTSSFRTASPRISDEIIKPDVKAIIKHGSVRSQSVVIVRAQDSSDEKIAEEEAVCKLCLMDSMMEMYSRQSVDAQKLPSYMKIVLLSGQRSMVTTVIFVREIFSTYLLLCCEGRVLQKRKLDRSAKNGDGFHH